MFNFQINSLKTKYDNRELIVNLSSNLFGQFNSDLNYSSGSIKKPKLYKCYNKKDEMLKIILHDNIDNVTIESGEKNDDSHIYCNECLENIENSSKFSIYLNDLKTKTIQYLIENMFKEDKLLEMKEVFFELEKHDPEFILKLALFCRKDLNIRSVSNYLIGLSASFENCRKFLRKYMKHCILIPNDWLECCSFFIKITGSYHFPSQFRKHLSIKFNEFKLYQIGKYKNKEYSVKIQEKEIKLNFKNMIRILHISDPVEHVMSIIGKKYPNTREEYLKSRLPGEWNEEMAGKRMKIPIPETWETKLSMEKDKSKVWESLIDSNNLPYMAMIRNLRNIIESDISKRYHEKIVSIISREKSVIEGKLLPSQYFTAFNVLDKYNESEIVPLSDKKHHKKIFKKKNPKVMIKDIIQSYTQSLNKAIEIATIYNIPPIRGKTLLVANLGDNLSTIPSKFGTGKSVKETISLMSSLCYFASEYVDLYIIQSNTISKYTPNKKPKSILPMSRELPTNKNYISASSSAELFNTKVVQKIFYDSIIIFNEDIPDNIILNYIKMVNKNVKIFRSIFNNNKKDLKTSKLTNVYDIKGFNEQFIRIISESSNGGIIEKIDNIDQKYNLILKDEIEYILSDPYLNIKLEGNYISQSYFNLFLSSTFKDMVEERNYFNRLIIPEMKVKLSGFDKSKQINCIDLQWGVPEEWGEGERVLDHCIEQVLKCDYFIGIYGLRYGWVPNENVLQNLSFKYPDIINYNGFSITHIEYKFVPEGIPKYLLLKDSLINENDIKSNNQKLRLFCNEILAEAQPYSDEISIGNSFYIIYKNFREFQESLKIYSELILGKIHYSTSECSYCLIHNRDQRFSSIMNYQKMFLQLFSEYKNSSFKQQVQELITFLEIDLLKEGLNYKIEINRRNELDSRKYINRNELTYIPGGILMVTGYDGCGKSTLISSLAMELSDICYHSKYTLKKSREIIYIWHYPFIAEILNKKFCSPNLCDLMYDLIEFFIRCFGDDLIGYLKTFLKDQTNIDTTRKFFWIANNLQDCLVIWKVLLECINVPKHTNITLFIDGIQELTDSNEALTLNWLPLVIPHNLRFVITLNKYKNASINRKCLLQYDMKSIPHFYRKHSIDCILKKQGKILNRSNFNNQVGDLSLKSDSGKPIYLNFAIHFMNCFGNYENLSQLISQIPSTLSKLVESLFEYSSKEIPKEISSVYLSFILHSKNGLKQDDIQCLLNAYFRISKRISLNNFSLSYSNIIKEECKFFKPCPLVFVIILNNLFSGIIQRDDIGIIKIKYHTEEVKRFTRNNNSSVILHILSSYFEVLMNSKSDITALLSILHYKIKLGQYVEYFNILLNLDYLNKLFNLGLSTNLINEFIEAEKYLVHISDDYIIKCFEDTSVFIMKNFRFLINNPHLFYQQALNESHDSAVKLKMTLNNAFDWFSIKQLSESYCNIFINQNLVYPNFINNPYKDIHVSNPITCCVLSTNINKIFLGFTSGLIQSFSLVTLQIDKNMSNHVFKINRIQVFDNSNKVVSVDDSGKVIVWMAKTGILINELNAHKSSVTDCAISNSLNLICTCSIDCKIITWKMSDFQIDSTYKTKSPINCIAVHPINESKLIAACWDGAILIFDLDKLQRKAILHQINSVRSISFQTNENLMISTDICGEISLWNTFKGVKVKTIDTNLLNQSVSVKYLHGQNTFIQFSGLQTQSNNISVWNNLLAYEKKKFELVGATCLDSLDNFLVIGTQYGELWMCKELKIDDAEIISICNSNIVDIKIVYLENEELSIICADFHTNIYLIKNAICSLLFETIHPSQILSMAFHDSNLFTADKSGTLSIHSLLYNTKINDVLIFEGPISALAISKFGLLAGSYDKSLALIDFNNGEVIAHKINCHKEWITNILNLNSKDFVSSCSIGSFKIWTYNETLKEFQLKIIVNAHCREIFSMEKMEEFFLTASTDGFIKFWNDCGILVESLKVVDNMIKDSADSIKSVKALNQREIIVLDNQNNLRIFQMDNKLKVNTLIHHQEPITDISVNENILYSVSLDNSMKLWKLDALLTKNNEKLCIVQEVIFLTNYKEYTDVICMYDISGILIFWAQNSILENWKIIEEINLKTYIKKTHFKFDKVLSMACLSMIYDYNTSKLVLNYGYFQLIYDLFSKFQIEESESIKLNKIQKKWNEVYQLFDGKTMIIGVSNDMKNLYMKITENLSNEIKIYSIFPLSGEVTNFLCFLKENKYPNVIITYKQGFVQFIDLRIKK